MIYSMYNFYTGEPAMIMNMFMFKAAIFLMLLIIAREILRKKFNIDLDKIDVKNLKNIKSQIKQMRTEPVKRTSGNKTLIMKSAGVNKATVMATLRQITGLDYNGAKNLVEHTPSVIMTNVSEKDADLTKKALEFVGAEMELQ